MLKKLIKQMLQSTPFRVSRQKNPSRFDAMSEILLLIHEEYPEIDGIIDVGANIGQWFSLTYPIFLNHRYYLIEPQASCWNQLNRLSLKHSNISIHKTGLSDSERMGNLAIPANGQVSTGASIVTNGISVQKTELTTLNHFVRETTTGFQNGLLKIDTEGHEAAILKGAEEVIRQFKIIIIEARFTRNEGDASDIIGWMNLNNFKLIDIAAISGEGVSQDGRAKLCDLVFHRKNQS